jgi:TQXA domain-containing protein
MTATTLRSYDHYAPDIAATVLPGAPVPAGPYWTSTVTRRSVTAGSRIRWADGTTSETELVRLDEQLPAYALLPGATTASYREVSWLESDWLPSEWALTQVLAQGYGRVGIDELRRRLRRAGYAVAAEELTIHDAIAGTQAAVWHVSTGRKLDARHVNPVGVSHLYDYLLGRAGVSGHGRSEARANLGARYFVAGVSPIEIRGAEVVDSDGRSLAGVVVPGQRFHLKGAGRRISLRHGAVRARLLSGDGRHLVTVTDQAPVVVDHIVVG